MDHCIEIQIETETAAFDLAASNTVLFGSCLKCSSAFSMNAAAANGFKSTVKRSGGERVKREVR